MSEAITRQTGELVAAAVQRQHVDGVQDLATVLPRSVLPDLVGRPRGRLPPTRGETRAVSSTKGFERLQLLAPGHPLGFG